MTQKECLNQLNEVMEYFPSLGPPFEVLDTTVENRKCREITFFSSCSLLDSVMVSKREIEENRGTALKLLVEARLKALFFRIKCLMEDEIEKLENPK